MSESTTNEEPCESFFPPASPVLMMASSKKTDKLDALEAKLKAFEKRIISAFSETEEIKLLRTIPGIPPSVHASGGKYRYGRAPADTNHYLKWAYAEAANTIMRVRRRLRYRHVADLYDRIRSRKGHSIAIGAVSRHLAEASWSILTKNEPYREPVRKKEAVSSTNG